MSDSVLVSVVLPTHNRAHLLQRAICSVLGQTHTHLELIVVDDASTDDTAQVVAELNDPRLHYLKLSQNKGVSAARNAGIKQAQGDWLAFQDSDDEWRVEKLQRQLAAADSDTQLVICGSWYPHSPWQTLISADADLAVSDVTDRIFLKIPAAPTFLARRSALMQVGGFDEKLSFCEDWELALRLRSLGRILWVNDALIIQHRTENSLFTTESNAIEGLKYILDKHGTLLRRHPAAWSWYCNWLGQTLCQFDRCSEGRKQFRDALQLQSTSIRSWLNLCMSFFGSRIFRAYTQAARKLRRGGQQSS